MALPMTREEFIEDLTIMSKRSTSGSVLAARTSKDVGSEDPGDWASLLECIHGQFYVDDSDDEPTRAGGITSTPLYELGKIGTWPDGLFEKLSSSIWWIDPDEEINTLDVLAGIKK